MADSLALFGILNGCRCFISFRFYFYCWQILSSGFAIITGPSSKSIFGQMNACALPMNSGLNAALNACWMMSECQNSSTKIDECVCVCVCVGRNDNRRICCYIMNGLVWRQQVTALSPIPPPLSALLRDAPAQHLSLESAVKAERETTKLFNRRNN